MQNNFNKVFRSENGTVFTKLKRNEVKDFKGNYITVIDDQPIAVVDGKEVPMPSVLFNEIGVAYFFVDFYQHGLKMAKKHGIYYGVKQEPIRVWKNIQPGEPIITVIDGYIEHEIPSLDENSVAAQNVVKNEFYAMPKSVLAQKYRFERSEFDYDLYVPKSDVVSQWVYSDVNVYGILWGGFEFLTTPMINITNENDCYGCNYVVWWGNDGRLASYKVVGYFRACGTLFYEQPMSLPVAAAEATFEPPKILVC